MVAHCFKYICEVGGAHGGVVGSANLGDASGAWLWWARVVADEAKAIVFVFKQDP